MEKDELLKIFNDQIFQIDVDDLIDIANAAKGIGPVRNEDHPIDFLVTPHLLLIMGAHLQSSHLFRQTSQEDKDNTPEIEEFSELAKKAIKERKYLNPIFVS